MNLFKYVFKTFFTDKNNKKPELKVEQEQVENTMPQPEVRDSYSGEILDAKACTAKAKTTKINQVLKHLKEEGSIDSWTAIQRYGATRLSAIIFVLRSRGYDIVSIPNSVLDRNNNVCNYTNYQLYKKNNGKD
jgi:hypothetical protein